MIYYKRQIIIVIEGQVNFYDNETIQIYYYSIIAVNNILFQSHFKGDRIHTES